MTWYPEAAGTEDPGGPYFDVVTSSSLVESVTGRVSRESQEFHEKMAQKLGVQTEAGRVHLRAARVYREGKARFHENSDELGELPPKSIIAAHKSAAGFHKKAAEKAGLDTDEAHAHVAELERHLDVINKAKRQLKTSEAGVKGMKWGAKKGSDIPRRGYGLTKNMAKKTAKSISSMGFKNEAKAVSSVIQDAQKSGEFSERHVGRLEKIGRKLDRNPNPRAVSAAMQVGGIAEQVGSLLLKKTRASEHGTERKRSGFSDRYGVSEAEIEEFGIPGMSWGGHKKALLGHPGKKKKPMGPKDPEEIEKRQKKKELIRQWSGGMPARVSGREAYLEPRQEDSHEEGTFVGPRYEKSHQAERGS